MAQRDFLFSLPERNAGRGLRQRERKARDFTTSVPYRIECSLTRTIGECCLDHKPPPQWITCDITPWISHILGILVSLIAGSALSFGSCLIKAIRKSNPDLSAFDVSGYRSIFAILYTCILLCVIRPSLGYKSLRKSQIAGILGLSLIFSGKFTSFTIASTLMPLSDFTLACNSVPLFTAVLGCCILSEHCGFREVLACLAVLSGVAITVFPEMTDLDAFQTLESLKDLEYGYILAVSSALFTSTALICLRSLTEIHPLYITLSATSVTAIVWLGAKIALDGWVFVIPENHELILIACAGLCMLGQSLLPAVACCLTEPSKVAVVMTSSVVFSIVIQSYEAYTLPGPYNIIGATLIFIAVIVSNLPQTPKSRADSLFTSLNYNPSNYGSLA